MKKDSEIHRLELAISHFLRWGVMLSALLLALGWFGQLLQSGDVLANFKTYNPEPMTAIVSKAWAIHDVPMLISVAGLAVLVSLPTLRVLLTAYLFVRQRDTYLAAMAVFVFAVLMSSFFLGIEMG